ncbi:hypothetical protein AB0D04_13900 [Streptomyces sp. NPDC048483]
MAVPARRLGGSAPVVRGLPGSGGVLLLWELPYGTWLTTDRDELYRWTLQ